MHAACSDSARSHNEFNFNCLEVLVLPMEPPLLPTCEDFGPKYELTYRVPNGKENNHLQQKEAIKDFVFIVIIIAIPLPPAILGPPCEISAESLARGLKVR